MLFMPFYFSLPNLPLSLSKVKKICDVFNCRKDFLAIYDGGSKSSPMIGRFCDQGIWMDGLRFMENSAIVSTNNELFLHFVTDQDPNFQERGFGFEYNVFGKSFR